MSQKEKKKRREMENLVREYHSNFEFIKINIFS